MTYEHEVHGGSHSVLGYIVMVEQEDGPPRPWVFHGGRHAASNGPDHGADEVAWFATAPEAFDAAAKRFPKWRCWVVPACRSWRMRYTTTLDMNRWTEVRRQA